MTDVAIEGLRGSKFEDLGNRVRGNAVRAVNAATRRANTQAKREITGQIAFPPGYLAGPDARLKVGNLATRMNPSATIAARTRATSLARFSPLTTPYRRGGVPVTVKPGSTKMLAKAFLIRLPQGDGSGGGYNLGLAVRVADAKSISGLAGVSSRVITSGRMKGLLLLYGPSVDQVFRHVRDDIAGDVASYMAGEFVRLMNAGV